MHAEGCWPEWLAEDLPEVKVWSLEYQASPSRWLGESLPREHRDNILLTQLESRLVVERPFVLVCHSLGGLVAKEILRLGHELGDERWRRLVGRCRGVVFIATPHDGSRLADYLSALGNVLRATDTVRGLQANTHELLRLTQWYRNNARRLGIATLPFYEVQATRGVRVVDETSADPKIEGVVPRAIDSDHLAIVKLASRDALYRLVLGFARKRIGATAPTRSTLPARPSNFTGREKELDRLCKLLTSGGRGVTIRIDGRMGGAGKTALALEAAYRVAEQFPDGVRFVDLRGIGPAEPFTPEQAVAAVIEQLEPTARLPDHLDQLRPLYRRVLAGKRRLLLLDNAKDTAQVKDLVLPESVALLITSRDMLVLPGAVRIELPEFSPDEARELLRKIIGEKEASDSVLDELVKVCGRLPLALQAAGAFLANYRDWDVPTYLDELRKHRLEMLSKVAREDPAFDVQNVLGFSLDRLQRDDNELAERFPLLVVFPAGFDAEAAAAVWEVELPNAREALSRLVARSLLHIDIDERGRYRLHELIRELAQRRIGGKALEVPRLRHAKYYRDVLARANNLFIKGGDDVFEGLRLFDLERANIEVGQGWTASNIDVVEGAKLAYGYVKGGGSLLDLRLDARARTDWLAKAIDGCKKDGNILNEADAVFHLAKAHEEEGNLPEAIRRHEQALELLSRVNPLKASVFGNLGFVKYRAREPDALRHLYRALNLANSAENSAVKAGNSVDVTENRLEKESILHHIGLLFRDRGEPDKAHQFFDQALKIARDIGDVRGQGDLHGSIGSTLRHQGEPDKALEHHEIWLGLVERTKDKAGEGRAHHNIGLDLVDLGRLDEAEFHFKKYLDIAQMIGNKHDEANATGSLADLHARKGNLQGALPLFQLRREKCREIEDDLGLANTWFDQARALDGNGDPEGSRGCAREALSIFRRIGAAEARKVEAFLRERGVDPDAPG